MKNTGLTLLVSMILLSCSLAPSAANRSYKAFDSGNYKESIRLVNRALSTYEYSDGEKADLLYLLETFPETEAAYRAKVLMGAVKKSIKAPSTEEPIVPKSQV